MNKRRMIWVKSEFNQGWACSECAWAFDDEDAPQGDTIDEMARNYELKRDQVFAAHVCSQHRGKDEVRKTRSK
jgi:hypothetical protein